MIHIHFFFVEETFCRNIKKFIFCLSLRPVYDSIKKLILTKRLTTVCSACVCVCVFVCVCVERERERARAMVCTYSIKKRAAARTET